MFIRIFLKKPYPNTIVPDKKYHIDIQQVRLFRRMVYNYGYDNILDALQNRFFWKFLGRYTEKEDIIWIYNNWSDDLLENKIEYID